MKITRTKSTRKDIVKLITNKGELELSVDKFGFMRVIKSTGINKTKLKDKLYAFPTKRSLSTNITREEIINTYLSLISLIVKETK